MPDFNQIVKEVKSVLRPGIVVPKDKESDPIAYRIAELSDLVKKLAGVNAQQGKDIAKINNMLIGLFEDLQKMKEADGIPVANVEPKPEAQAEAPKEEEAVPPPVQDMPETEDSKEKEE